MLREIVNRKLSESFPEQEWDNYFPQPQRKVNKDKDII